MSSVASIFSGGGSEGGTPRPGGTALEPEGTPQRRKKINEEFQRLKLENEATRAQEKFTAQKAIETAMSRDAIFASAGRASKKPGNPALLGVDAAKPAPSTGTTPFGSFGQISGNKKTLLGY